ncbi:MAG: 6-carboxytetrahydropterin synthase [Phycisphaerales bacterium]|nr:6-carboxytetrahydropterin synthase [Phycisphaerales bacterium]
MVRLSRTIRFTIPDRPLEGSGGESGLNGFGGKPTMCGLGRYYELDVRCTGDPDPQTGYLINIKAVDDAVRACAVPFIADQVSRPGADPIGLIGPLLGTLRAALPVETPSVAWRLTPFLELEARMGDEKVLVRQRFEFSASHRLHVPRLSDEENRRIFGKCNNPAGHGHNYRVEPCVAVDPARPLAFDAIESIVDQHVIEPLDHKHLNSQVAEFSDEGGVNPSVEHIARVCFDRLAGPLCEAGAELRAVTVWETDRTSCTYPA